MQKLPVDVLGLIFERLPKKERIRNVRVCRRWQRATQKTWGDALINLSGSGITDEGLKHLKGVRNLNLYSCKRVTDKGLIYIEGVQSICIGVQAICINNPNGDGEILITDEGFKHLKAVQEINLCGCTNITDEGFKQLKAVRRIFLDGTGITDLGLKHLKGVERIDIYSCPNITDEGLLQLEGAIIVYPYRPPGPSRYRRTDRNELSWRIINIYGYYKVTEGCLIHHYPD